MAFGLKSSLKGAASCIAEFFKGLIGERRCQESVLIRGESCGKEVT